jgi:hypothetical protein
MQVEKFEKKAIDDARQAFAKLSIEAQQDFLQAESWAENHIGTALIFGIIMGIGLVLMIQHMLAAL